MSKKINIPKDNNILTVPLEEAMPDNYLPYAVEVAKDRALPDVRDGLKPVHRRILYGAYIMKAYPDRPYFKSARIVGDILGKYHPHGDSSVYEAMVILAQDFSTRMPLVDGHGNWGSQDGDSAAAMRYTEARLSPIAMEMLKDIEKDVVNMVDNYSDTEKEPEVLPSRYPNILVNGAFGIAVGLSTNIPPHNLGEVIDGVIALADNKDITTKEIMNYIKGPDLPTGGILIGETALYSAYEKGEGRVTLRAKTSIEKLENGRYGIIITEFPYRKNKAKILQTISNMTGEKKHSKALESISDIRDESDRNGVRAVIEFKKSAYIDTVNKVLKYLFKKTELQCNLIFNMVALVNGKPEKLNLKSILYYYLEHQKEIVTRRTKKELEIAEKKFHIIEGFIRAINIMDEVIKTIRSSKSKKDAQSNLMNEFDFTAIQSEAILELMLYRLTGLEIKTFEKEHRELQKLIQKLNKILGSEKELIKVIKKEMIEIKEKYFDERRTQIIGDDSEAQIAVDELIVEEDVIITLSNEGYIKRISLKSYNRSSANVDDIEYREGDFNKLLLYANTKYKMLIFTDKGNMYRIKCVDIPEHKWKDKGERIDTLIKGLSLSNENIVGLFSVPDMTAQKYFLFFTSIGGMKKTELYKFDTAYSKIQASKLRKNEKIICVKLLDNSREEEFILFKTKIGLKFSIQEPKLEYSDRNVNPQEIVKIGALDSIVYAEIEKEYEYKIFTVSVNSKGLIKLSSSRNKLLMTKTNSSQILCIFTEEGKVFTIPAYLIQSLDYGCIKLSELFSEYNNLKPVRVISCNGLIDNEINNNIYVYTITQNGIIRKTNIYDFISKGFSCLESKLKENDRLISVILSYEECYGDIVIVSKNGMCIRFDCKDVNTMKRNATGVIAISLSEYDKVIFGTIICKNGNETNRSSILVKTKSGYEWKITFDSIKVQNRAGKGKKVIELHNGDIITSIK